MGVSIEGLTVSIGGKDVVRGVDVSVGQGERVGLVGASGSGKTMISKAIMGLLPIQADVSGSIRLGGRQIVGCADGDMADIRGRDIALVPQNPMTALNPVERVGWQVGRALRIHTDLDRGRRRACVLRALESVGLDPEVAGRYPHELSGGQCQRVCMAAAIVTSPRLIIADEPTTALDSLAQREVIELLIRLVERTGSSLLFITHDYAVLSRVVTRTYVVDGGCVVESAPIADLIAAPKSPAGVRLASAARFLTLGRVSGEVVSRSQKPAMRSSVEPVLSARGLTVFRGAGHARVRILEDVDLDVASGRALAVIGGSGSGKTTLVRALLGLENDRGGSVSYRGLAVAEPTSPGCRALRREASMVSQSPFASLDPWWSVERSVAEPLRIAGWKDRAKIRARVEWALTVVGLEPSLFMRRYPVDLSGGQAQRVALARAMSTRPHVIVADEPMSALDVVSRTQVIDAFAAMREASPDMALVIVSHDLGVVHRIADDVVALHDGRVVERNRVGDLIAKPRSQYVRSLVDAATM
ncbi:ABC transporter ATP-binding protein [uncultured Bifidobacterium sp.]|uniref:ABC transporter ATP-binding protein n=1 Tax=uncultured Bifidobacterium sp. TaxID=165187 RepID=UPI0026251C0F|nr:ABC transporter ATP-binding protein [uncultured Bifidobacterium sp.]